jgi:hypothetical protein
MTDKKEIMTDKIVEQVVAKFRKRSDVGIKKYGTTLCRNEAEILERLTHLEEELMDATLYIQWLKQKLEPQDEQPTDIF